MQAATRSAGIKLLGRQEEPETEQLNRTGRRVIRGYLKIIFWPGSAVVLSFQVLKILMRSAHPVQKQGP